MISLQHFLQARSNQNPDSPAICPQGWITATTFRSISTAFSEDHALHIALSSQTSAALCCPSYATPFVSNFHHPKLKCIAEDGTTTTLVINAHLQSRKTESSVLSNPFYEEILGMQDPREQSRLPHQQSPSLMGYQYGGRSPTHLYWPLRRRLDHQQA